MTAQIDLQDKLRQLRVLPSETEWIEFKEAKNNFDFDDLGKYFSALSNEANLKNQSSGWLVFGLRDKPIPRQIVGTNYRPLRPDLDSLKEEIANGTSHRITFEEIHELQTLDGRVLLFQIPAALRGSPTSWKGHFYGRDHENLCPLNLYEIEQIRKQDAVDDWSVAVCEYAKIDDLDPKAIAFAIEAYTKKNPSLAEEISNWDTITFLNKAKLCIEGKITRAAVVLLGRHEADHLLGNCHPQLSWILKDREGMERDYKHFNLPLILAVDPLLAQIRNLTCRVLPEGTLFPTELLQYEPWILRESIHNAIAHQDYTLGGRVNVVEFEDRLVIVNKGSFLPGDIESVIRRDAPFSVYRNAFLSQAMVSLGMIDTIGSGIKRIFQTQKKRSFPMPDFDLTVPNEVKMMIGNRVLDERYTRMLLARADLGLWDVIALDKVQKGKPLTDEEFKSLKSKKLVEGRRQNLFVSAEIAAITDTLEEYLHNRGIDKSYCKKMVLELLETKTDAKREDIDRLLRKKISDAITEEQKTTFIRNLLQEMRREKSIERSGAKTGPKAAWRLSSKGKNDTV
jgi:ATP-dependent DNA helicase RecG